MPKKQNKFRALNADQMFEAFRSMYQDWEIAGKIHPDLLEAAGQINTLLLCFDDQRKEWLAQKFAPYNGSDIYRELSNIGLLINGIHELYLSSNVVGVNTGKARGDHPLARIPLVPEPNNPGPWFEHWANHNPREWWALCRLKPDTARLRLQQNILDCGSLQPSTMEMLWEYATKLEQEARKEKCT